MTTASGPDEEVYGADLAPGERRPARYAASATPSRGRRFPEPPAETRSPFQRDRDRVIHATAFRRLTYKTQVFVYHEGDHFRSRLTHSLEVAQIARTMARQLRLDEDLAEVIALAHDLGHPPFGHTGERALDRAVRAAGGFDHNIQSFRVVTALERKYLDFDGLNLTWESLEGLVKHNGPPAASGKPEDERLIAALSGFEREFALDLDRWPSAEAQVASLADDIAWHTHDIDDGLRAGLLSLDDLSAVSLVRDELARIGPRGGREEARIIFELTRRLITRLIADAVAETRRRLAELAPASPASIRAAPAAVAQFSPPMAKALSELRTYLFANLYRHPRVNRIMAGAEAIVTDLVARYLADPAALPDAWRSHVADRPADQRMRHVADFVAGQTDRFAVSEHRRLFDATPDLR